MQIPRAVLRLVRRPDVATPMHRLSSPSGHLSSMASRRRRWPPTLARRLVAAPSPPVRRASSEATWDQDVNLDGCEEDPRSVTKDRTTEIVIKEDEEVSDYVRVPHGPRTWKEQAP